MMAEVVAVDSSTSALDDVQSAMEWIRPAGCKTGGELVLRVLHEPSRLAALSLDSWTRLMPIAMYLGVWSQICVRVRQFGFESNVPAPIRHHLQSAILAADANETRIRWEVSRLQAALNGVDYPVVVLKGAAFLLSGYAFSKGRRFGDLDILVPEDCLTRVEAALRQRGWVRNEERPLHLLYYRRWLHEIAPMWHAERKVPLDVHYTIIRPKDRLKFDPSSLFDGAIPLSESPLRVLAPADMFLHAAANLFRTGEFDNLFRDLWDMREMAVRFSQEAGFWGRVAHRAGRLNLRRECFLALRYLNAICGIQVPLEDLESVTCGTPHSLSLRFYDGLVRRCLFPRTLDRIDTGRRRMLTLREWWPPPRLKAVFSYLFWRKRLPADPMGVFFKNAAERGRGAEKDE